ncbi:hypothetical protein FEM03_10260 [Phragmitibacter flavus]|uniref:Uncharacterized protein n=1 Tax=Phragmitibacter flavus TaxID=2576071 RepID=A0A5R8KEL1_9BACT|nr:hypothetical protein [Phragmitibacter flavus]TLD70687.1 hypothetical protein FEM03_10260 [Phragmitibacter flavus]
MKATVAQPDEVNRSRYCIGIVGGNPNTNTNAKAKAVCCLMVLTLMSFIAPAQSAVTLGLWDFDNNAELNFLNTAPTAGPYGGSVYSNSAGAVAQVSVSSLTVGSGLTGSSAGAISGTGTAAPPAYNGVRGADGSNVYVFPASSAVTGSPATATAAVDYFSVTLTPDASSWLSVSGISFYAWANQNFTSGSYSFFVQSSLTGNTILGSFTKVPGDAGAAVNNNTAPTDANNLYAFDLSGHSELTNVTGPVTFFVGVYGNANGSLRLDELQITGSVVPEPSRAILVGFALTGCLLQRLRRRKSWKNGIKTSFPVS